MAAPLTREDLTNINTALKAAKEVKAVIARAKQAGLDVKRAWTLTPWRPNY